MATSVITNVQLVLVPTKPNASPAMPSIIFHLSTPVKNVPRVASNVLTLIIVKPVLTVIISKMAYASPVLTPIVPHVPVLTPQRVLLALIESNGMIF